MIPAPLRHLGHEGPRHTGRQGFGGNGCGPACTAFDATTCPWHGECTCLPGFFLSDLGCQLHSLHSSHAAEHLEGAR